MRSVYHPEPYWNEVAKNIAERTDHRMIAGDDEPFYRYQRKKFLEILARLPFRDKTVLELGPGPGGNLGEVYRHRPKALWGADISDEMISLAQHHLRGKNIRIKKTDGTSLPFSDGFFDLSYTSTVLQHNTDTTMLEKLVAELCRVSREEIYIFEKIEKQVRGTALCVGRPVAAYAELFAQHGFELQRVQFLNLPASHLVSGAIRKIFQGRKRKEGEPVGAAVRFLQKITLPLTSLADRILPSRRGIALLHFRRQ